jgi:hypothetical protein
MRTTDQVRLKRRWIKGKQKGFATSMIRLLAVFILANVCLAQSVQSSETPEAKYSKIICTCSYQITVGINLTRKSGEELIIPNKDIFKIYEDGVLQKVKFFRVNDDEAANTMGFRYVIGYEPSNEKINGAYRKIRIVPKMRGVKIYQSGAGYFATEENRRKSGNILPSNNPYSSKGCCS